MVSDLVDKYIENEKKDDITNITILDQFLKLYEKNEINKRILLFSCADLLFTGVDSTANTALFSLLELINNRNYQIKLYDQVKNNDGELILFNTKYNNNFTFLKLVLLETYRLHPALPLTPHYLIEDVEISDTKIAKGTQIILNIYSSHRSDKQFKSPNDFIPERFEKENDEMDLVAFGIGVRDCIGKSIAKSEIFTIIATLINRYEFINPNPLVRDCIGKSIAKSELFTILATLINRYEFINPNPLVPLNNIGSYKIGLSCPNSFILIKKRNNKN
ncbi:hypothetical protein ACTFIR_008411 [Dictyostelium discoideum]